MQHNFKEMKILRISYETPQDPTALSEMSQTFISGSYLKTNNFPFTWHDLLIYIATIRGHFAL